MSNVELAIAAIRRAGRWLQGAARAREDGRWDDVVYSSQMGVELSAKAVLIAFGIDFPREHDVSLVFDPLARRADIPRWFRDQVPAMSNTIAELAELRGVAGYGLERGIGVEYFKDYAPEALEAARNTHAACLRLLRQLFNVD
ncbi:MAG: HEPN domain-containing protein [Candidatus Bathyarchaeia archaeon]